IKILADGARKVDEPDSWIAVRRRLIPCHRLGESLLSVKAVSRRANDVSILLELQASPEGLLNPFAARRRPHDLLKPHPQRSALKACQQTPVGVDFQRADRVVGGKRRKRDIVGIAVECAMLVPAHVLKETFPPAAGI